MLTHSEKTLTTLSLRETRGRLCRFMTGLGYEIIGTDADILFERGGPFGSIPGSPLRAWKMRVFAHITPGPNGSQVLLRWEIPKGGRLMSVWDAGYLRKEVQGALQTVSAQDVNLDELEKTHMSAAFMTLAVYLAAFLTITVTVVLMVTGDLPAEVMLLALLIVLAVLIAIRAPLIPRSSRRSV